VRKYVLDTNLYVRAFRNAADATELEAFYSGFAPGVYLSSIVMHEVMVGARGDDKRREVEKELVRPFRRTRRVVAPSHAAWQLAGEGLGRLAEADGLDLRRVPKSFVNDVLIAASCSEAGMTLVTDNTGDFRRIRSVISIDFVGPWPS